MTDEPCLPDAFPGAALDATLDAMALLAVRVGARVSPGQGVVLLAPTAAMPLVRRVVATCYGAGASHVTPVFTDRAFDAARARFSEPRYLSSTPTWMWDGIRSAFEAGAARISIDGDDPFAMADLPAEAAGKVADARSALYMRALRPLLDFAVNWTMVPYVNPAWARCVFPGRPQADAEADLWRAVAGAVRADVADPVGAWASHNARLAGRCEALNGARLRSLRFRDDGTDLSVGLADGHVWLGGETVAANGVAFNANIPTEEVFTAPHREGTWGHVRATKPLARDGGVIRDVEMRFEAGRVVEARARTGQDGLRRMLATDDGASRLGEVALVPASSTISRSGLLFFNTLFDENAASHLALGRAYPKCVQGAGEVDDDALASMGLNASGIHVDWMVGSTTTDVDGTLDDGTVVPVMRRGEWADP